MHGFDVSGHLVGRGRGEQTVLKVALEPHVAVIVSHVMVQLSLASKLGLAQNAFHFIGLREFLRQIFLGLCIPGDKTMITPKIRSEYNSISVRGDVDKSS